METTIDIKTINVLKKLEWSLIVEGMTGGFGRGPDVSCCPICLAVNPDDPNANTMPERYHHHGHKKDCELMDAINRQVD
jgi:hypothetical protein